MKIFILDTNVIFSAALSPNNAIGRFILSSSAYNVQFYAPTFLQEEIERYVPKIMKGGKYTEEQARRIITLLYSRITFISDSQIPIGDYVHASVFVAKVDIDDLPFVALSSYLDELLWTGDKELFHGLRSRGYTRVVTFDYIKNNIL